jgi:hypothetical protein
MVRMAITRLTMIGLNHDEAGRDGRWGKQRQVLPTHTPPTDCPTRRRMASASWPHLRCKSVHRKCQPPGGTSQDHAVGAEVPALLDKRPLAVKSTARNQCAPAASFRVVRDEVITNLCKKFDGAPRQAEWRGSSPPMGTILRDQRSRATSAGVIAMYLTPRIRCPHP